MAGPCGRGKSGSGWWEDLWSTEATLVYLAWYAWTVACWYVLPGKQVEGATLRNGQTISYKMNPDLLQMQVCFNADFLIL
ncbi:MAG: hypothetical protein EOO82_03800 [Oxalobacteraceae bacterium]|nr:MAG: hypothetical protein EOO82_03800 [Oxalobacteraceae bacterium]